MGMYALCYFDLPWELQVWVGKFGVQLSVTRHCLYDSIYRLVPSFQLHLTSLTYNLSHRYKGIHHSLFVGRV
jgi:hypothetical protein